MSGTATYADSLSITDIFSTPTAHAWTYGNPLTSTNAVTTSGNRCTGAQIASLGSVSGSGAMPSVQNTVWNYMGSQPSLPANYNNGTYCIQAVTEIVFEGEGGFEARLFDSFIPKAFAAWGGGGGGSSSWTITYSIHSGTGKTAEANHYALTYTVSAVTANLTASPSSVENGSSSLLTWSSTSATSCTGTGFSTGGATSGSVSVSPTTNTTYSVMCSGATSASQSATVTVTNRPNLKAGATTPTSATVGQVVTFSSTIQNAGNAATAVNSSVLFQRATSAAGAGATSMGTYSLGTLATGATQAATLSASLPSTGTHYVRACADNGNTVNESNEGDNCSAWTAVSVSDASGETGVWEETGETYRRVCTGGENSTFINTCPTSSSVGGVCSPLGATCSGTFDAQEAASNCTPGAGEPTEDGYVTTYQCISAGTGSGDVDLTATPATINVGESSTLNWTSSGTSSCSSDHFATGGDVVGSVLVSPVETTTYLISCISSGAGGGSGGGGDLNVPFVQNEWWTGGTSEVVLNEAMHNNDFSQFEQGYGIEELCASYAGEHDAWNLQVRETNNTGDAGTDIMYLTCYGVNDPTGTTAKPQETVYRSRGEPDVITYVRSDSTPGDTGGVVLSVATVTVNGGTQCSDGLNNDNDGIWQDTPIFFSNSGVPACPVGISEGSACSTVGSECRVGGPGSSTQAHYMCEAAIDLDDPDCTDGDDDTEGSSGSLSCGVSNSTPQAGGSATYTVTPSGGAEAPYTWTPLSGQTCEGGDDTTEGCTFPGAQLYQMRVTADGGQTTMCPVVDTSCSLDSVSIGASPDRVRAGNATTITWEADTSCTCSVSGPGLSSSEPNGSQAVTVTKQSRYTISCQAGAAEDFVIVNIVPTLIEF